MDTKRFIPNLNTDLETECRPIVRYTQHTASSKALSTAGSWMSCESIWPRSSNAPGRSPPRVDFPGGAPNEATPSVSDHRNDAAALHADLTAEGCQLERYRTRVAEARKSGRSTSPRRCVDSAHRSRTTLSSSGMLSATDQLDQESR